MITQIKIKGQNVNKEKEFEDKLGINIVQLGMLTKMLTQQCFCENKTEVTPEQFIVLMTLFQHGELYKREISKITYKDRPNVHRLVSILEKKGFVDITIGVNKRQISKVRLTNRGIEIYQKTLDIILNVWHLIHSELSDDELSVYLRINEKLSKTIKSKVKIQI